MLKKGIALVSLVILVIVLSKWELVTYLVGQGKGQFEVLINAVSLDEYLIGPKTDSLAREKIALISEVKKFCGDELGMAPGDKYTTIYDQRGQDILWNVTACEPFALISKEWTFPLIGSVSYKGFFDLEKAKAEEQSLKDQGYDTRIRTVSAWSTLGWFNDPILSRTLERAEGSLAELIIHEVTHSHIFFSDSLVFNENIASFIGEQGAQEFLKMHFGDSSAELSDYLNSESDYQLFTDHVLRGKKLLGELYGSFENGISVEEKNQRKNDFMITFVAQIDTITFSDATRFKNAFSKSLPNNAFFMAFDRYASLKDEMKVDLDQRFDGSLKKFIEFYKNESE